MLTKRIFFFHIRPGNLNLNYSNDQGPIQKKRIYTSYIQA